MNKHDVAKILGEIATLLEVQGENPFKVRAFQKAERTIEALDDDIETVVSNGTLEMLDGIGEGIAKKITTLVQTGRLPYYDELKAQVPKGVLEFLQLESLGAKKAKILYDTLGITTIDELVDACKNNEIAKLSGFGEKSQENILNSIKKRKKYSARHLWIEANKTAQPIVETLKKLPYVAKAEIAGSLRRKCETVGDIDFLVATKEPKRVMDWFTSQSFVEKVTTKGISKSSIRLKNGMQADLRTCSNREFAYTLMYFTGSREHNIALRKIANEKGLQLSEYGVKAIDHEKKAPKTAKTPTEQIIYKSLGLLFIPPELREDAGEIAASKKKNLPKLVEYSDLKGTFHCHTTYSDGHNTLEEIVGAAQNHNWEYIGIADHSKSSHQANGMNEERLFEQLAHIKKLNDSKKFSTHIFAGLECDILRNGTLDFPDEVLQALDYVVVSVHRSFSLSEKEMTKRIIKAVENPYSTMVGHLTGRLLLKRDPYKVDVDKVIDACIANNTIIELNAHPLRLDMDWRFWHRASEKGLKCVINPDAHATRDLDYCALGIHIARKGWLEKKHIINTFSLKKVRAFLKET